MTPMLEVTQRHSQLEDELSNRSGEYVLCTGVRYYACL